MLRKSYQQLPDEIINQQVTSIAQTSMQFDCCCSAMLLAEFSQLLNVTRLSTINKHGMLATG